MVRSGLTWWQRSWTGDVLGVGAVAVCGLALFWDGLVHARVYYERDTYAFYAPLTLWFARQLHQGSFALWTPLIFGGYPLFADGEIGVFSPIDLAAFWLLPPAQIVTALRMAHLLIGGVGMLVFLRITGVGRLGATVGGLAFAYCGFLVEQLAHENVVRTAVWLPWILLCIERGLRGRVSFLLLGGVCAGLAMLGVHIQPVVMIALATGLFVAWRLCVAPCTFSVPQRLLLVWGTPFLVFGVGLSLAAVQWLPLWEMAGVSPRGGGFDADAALAIGLRWQNLATVLFPALFRLDDGRSILLWDDWEALLFVGVIPLALTPLALVRGVRHRSLFFGALGLLALLAAFGNDSPIPVARWLLSVPGMSVIRIPGRYTFLIAFAAAGLAAEGANVLACSRWRTRAWFGTFVLAATGAVLLGVVLLRGQLEEDPETWRQRITDQYVTVRSARTYLSTDLVYDRLWHALDPVGPVVLPTLALLFGLGVLSVGWAARPTWRSAWGATLVLLVAIDALRFAVPFHPSARLDDLLRPSDVVARVKAYDPLGRIVVATQDDAVAANRLAGAEIGTLDGYSSLPDRRNLEYVGRLFRGQGLLLGLAGVRYLVADRRLVTPSDMVDDGRSGVPLRIPDGLKAFTETAAWPVRDADARVAILANPAFLPRAYIVAGAISAPSSSSALDALVQQPLNWNDTVVLDGPGATAAVGRQASPAPSLARAAPQAATIEDRSPTDVRVIVPDGASGFLVVTDAYYPGWRAMVDGTPADVIPANGLFRAVALPPGSRTVEMTFAPQSLTLGIGVSAVTLLLVSVALMAHMGRQITPWCRILYGASVPFRAKLLRGPTRAREWRGTPQLEA